MKKADQSYKANFFIGVGSALVLYLALLVLGSPNWKSLSGIAIRMGILLAIIIACMLVMYFGKLKNLFLFFAGIWGALAAYVVLTIFDGNWSEFLAHWKQGIMGIVIIVAISIIFYYFGRALSRSLSTK
jgi:hypothetical protein